MYKRVCESKIAGLFVVFIRVFVLICGRTAELPRHCHLSVRSGFVKGDCKLAVRPCVDGLLAIFLANTGTAAVRRIPGYVHTYIPGTKTLATTIIFGPEI